MIIGVLKEQSPETRVSLVPEVVTALVKMNVTVWIEQGAGGTSFYSDQSYISAGAEVKDAQQVRSSADILLTITAANVGAAKAGAVERTQRSPNGGAAQFERSRRMAGENRSHGRAQAHYRRSRSGPRSRHHHVSRRP